ncbi:carbohydrate ABC transporter permease [Mycoplasma marinum]|uniref:ABC transmembrane type-1 domain-containing protein n=1 Tax=Mycoplasma marinum TaxID=1937190 RepID=A0A4R0XLK3_9MOLU|nr:carbohydrate ABC transporter permease [Mycoplasma marinum]TCG11543.1 hypothetical protein C4B24_01700 [Mycoplasma marinum]
MENNIYTNIEGKRKNREFEKKLKRTNKINKVIKLLLYFFLAAYALISFYPLFWALISSFVESDKLKGIGIWPIPAGSKLTTENYNSLFTNPLTKQYATSWLMTSVIYSLSNATINCFFNFLAGYALARISFKGRKIVIWYIIVALMIPVQATQVPQLYILIKLGFIDPYQSNFIWFIGILTTGMTSGVLIFMVRQFYVNQSASIEEAGMIDGLSRFKVFLKVSIRSMLPLLATQWAMIFIGSWNNFIMFTLWASGDPTRMTITAAFNILADSKYGSSGTGRLLAATNLSILPVLAVYVISLKFQRKVMIDGEK